MAVRLSHTLACALAVTAFTLGAIIYVPVYAWRPGLRSWLPDFRQGVGQVRTTVKWFLRTRI